MKKIVLVLTGLLVCLTADGGLATTYTTIDLNPNGFTNSCANGINGNQQVGYGQGSATGNQTHAILWNSSAEHYVDLNPSGFIESSALATSGNQQVGRGQGSATGNKDHALLWNGSAADYIDLHQLLPAGFVSSYAESIDIYGNISGVAIDNSGNFHAIVWLVPEPTTLALIGLGIAMMRKYRK